DTSAPAAPVVNAGNGTQITGTAEAGALVSIDVDGDGTPDYTVTADGAGNWSITPDTPLADGVEVTATATDEAGNESAPTADTVDAAAPAAPVVNAGNGTEITGTAEAGALVSIDIDGDGTPDYTVTADGDGNWSVTPNTPLGDGVEVTATATDEAGNESVLGTDTVDATAPVVTINDVTTNDTTPELTGTVNDPTATV
ncbi:Ig-like domain-containing protein, partial [Alteromonas sp. 1_MG-2023]|uniref:Ig-like domain-containing protein n=1 Tax=Alteromonas sp. 1_MG-2023 TaxID=3062669 RepID=UPI0026E4734F